MKIISPRAEIISSREKPDIINHIERCARTCYKSEDKIKEGSAEKMVLNLIKNGHEAMLEHSSLCFKVNGRIWDNLRRLQNDLELFSDYRSFLRFTHSNVDRFIVSGNIRAWRDFIGACKCHYDSILNCTEKIIHENPTLFPEYEASYDGYSDEYMTSIDYPDLRTVSEMMTHIDVTVRFVVDRGVSHEIVRHRVASFAQESTRYCNYSREGFGGEITVIKPIFLQEGTEGYNIWRRSCEEAESAYFNLLNWGCTPEECRTVLPNSLKTEIIVTMNLGDWRHFFLLRALGRTGKPHPQMRQVALPLLEEFKGLFPEIFGDLEVSNNVRR